MNSFYDAVDGVRTSKTVAFRNVDDGSKVLIVLNIAAMDRTFAVRSSGRSFRFTVPGRAVATLRWR